MKRCSTSLVTGACQLSHFSCVRLFTTHGLQPSRLLYPRDSPGKNTGVGCHSFLQGIFLTQGSNPSPFMSPALASGFFTTIDTWEAPINHSVQLSHSVMSDCLQPTDCMQHTRLPCPIFSSSIIPLSSHLQSFPASGSFPNESVLCIRWPKYWSFSFSISPSNEYSGLISFRIIVIHSHFIHSHQGNAN